MRHVTSCLLFPAALVALVAGCTTTTQGAATAHLEAIDKSSQRYMSGITQLNGTYGPGCTDRGGPWSIAIEGNSDPLDYAPLSVVLNDYGCTLQVTEVKEGPMHLEAVTPFPLATIFQPAATSFAPSDGSGGFGPTAMYGNGMIMGPPGFMSDFTIQFLYSDQPNDVSASQGSSYAVTQSDAVAADIAAPADTVDLTGIAIQTDAENDVTFVSGSATLMTFCNESFAIDTTGALPDGASYAEIDAFFNAAAQTTSGCAPSSIDSSAFALLGATLPTTRKIVVAADVIGVRSYEVLTVTFEAPQPPI